MWTLLRSHSKCLLAFYFSSSSLGTTAKNQLTNALRQFVLSCTRLEFNWLMFTKLYGLNITTKVTFLAATSVLYFHFTEHFIFAIDKYKCHRGHSSLRQATWTILEDVCHYWGKQSCKKWQWNYKAFYEGDRRIFSCHYFFFHVCFPKSVFKLKYRNWYCHNFHQ